MGIPKLNSYLKQNCSKNSIDKKHLSLFTGKTIVIDSSIYLYKFAATNTIIQSIYQMIQTFKLYNIKPIFIFDGKPPDEKKELIYMRNDLKNEATLKCIELQNEYDILFNKLNKTDHDMKLMNVLMDNIEKARRQTLRVTWTDTEKVKKLLKLCDIDFYIAEGEADKLCVQFVLNNNAWACMSDDMDMFVYGCTRVLRGLSLYNHTVTYYNINEILRELDLKITDFRKISILSGTDYNIEQNVNIKDIISVYNIYKQSDNNLDFYEWYSKLNNININIDKLNRIYEMFCIDITDTIPKIDYSLKKSITIESFLRPYGFVFTS